MTKCTDKVKNIIDRQIKHNKYLYEGIPFSKYQKFYLSTNENIKDYLDNFDITDKENALSVLASGDHLLNLIEKGTKRIDTFDTNLLTKYYVFGLKYAMIIKYDYKTYLKTFKNLIDDNTPLETITSIINELLPLMDTKYRKFWNIINEYNYKLQREKKTNLNLMNMISLGDADSLDYVKNKNSYLENEDNYNLLKNNLLKTNVSFKNIDAINIPKKYLGKYDLMLLSNIPEFLGHYFYKQDFEEYINNLKNMLTDKGILFFNYIHNYATNNITRKNILIYLNEYGHNLINKEIIEVPSGKENMKSGVVILRKK